MFSIPRENSSPSELQTLENHSTELDLPVFNPGTTPTVTVQPRSGDDLTSEASFTTQRRPIPVSTIDWQSTNESQFIPRNGLDFLDGVDQLHIQQSIELHDLLSNVESENRYTVKVPRGETLYYASESSKGSHRLCFSSSRPFTMRLYDQTQQQAMEFRRRLACGTCAFWCYLQVLEVWLPPGELVGSVRQQTNLSFPLFLIYNRHGNIVYRIEGPQSACAFIVHGKDVHFKILNGDGTTQLGSINHQWDQVLNEYILSLQLPGRNVDTRMKALLLGAAFLFEYMYFEKKRSTCSLCYC